MLTNGLPAPLNISLVAGKETARDFYVFNEDGSKRDMRFYTFSGLVTTVEGEEYELSGSVSGTQEHCVTMQIPALPMGTHRYSLNAASDTGEIESFVSGVLGVQYPDLSALEIAPVESPTNAVIIKLPGDGGLVRALWAQTSLTQKAVMDAINAAKAAEEAAAEAERSKNAALVALQDAMTFMDSFNKALMQSIQVVDNYLWIGGINTGHYLRGDDGETPRYGADGYWYIGERRVGNARGDDGITPHITSTGFWAIGEVVTNVRAAGRDGINGTAVRRILVKDYADIPQSGNTCNGGVYYYVRKPEKTNATGWIKATWNHSPSGTWIYVDGLEFYLDWYPGSALVDAINTQCSRVIAESNGDYIILKATDAGEIGNTITLSITTNAPSSYAVSGETLTGGAEGQEGYDVYAWLEPDGWVCVGDANDIATSEIYGLVKLGTDVKVNDGAPVGRNADGQASVPLAGTTVAGAGKLSTGIEITFGAEVGFDANKAYRVPVATMDSYGVGRLGINTTVDGAHVGFDSDGRWCVPWATLYTAGVIKLGSQFGQSNPIPYIVGIGATKNHELANNYAFGGALQHRKPDGWRGTMAWLDYSMSQSQQYFGDMFYSGVLTSAQFSQSQNNGLELLEATTELLAGVYIATGMDDERAAAVVSTGTLREVDEDIRAWVSENHYRKDEVYTQEETGDAIQNALAPYITKTEADAKYMPKNEPNLVRSGVGNIATIHKMSKSAFDALETRDDNAVYLVKRG